MASFVEQATLKLVDKSTPNLRKIDKELNKVLKTARAISKVKIDFKLAKPKRELEALNRILDKTARRKTISTRINVNGTAQAKRNINSVVSSLSKMPKTTSVAVKVAKTGLVHGGAVPGATVGVTGAAVASSSGSLAALRSTLNDSWRRLGYTIERAIVQGFARGATERDVGRSRLELQELTPAQTAVANRNIQNMADSDAGANYTVGQLRGAYSEINLITRGDEDAAGILFKQAIDMANLQVVNGENARDAINSAFLIVKAAEQTGATTDASGKFDETQTDLFFNTIKKSMIQGGVEISADLIKTLTKSLRTAKFGLSEEGWISVIALAEEQGSTTGVGINQLIKQAKGQGQAEYRIANLTNLGLLSGGEMVKTGTEVDEVTGATRSQFELRNAKVKGGSILDANPAQWTREFLMPALRDAGINTDSATEVSTALGDLFGRVTSIEAASALIARANEFKDIERITKKRNVDSERIADIAQRSTVAALANVGSSFENVLGQIAESMESVLLPAIRSVASGLDTVAGFIAGPDGEGSAARTATVVGGGAVAAGALAAGAKVLLNKTGLFGAATNLNLAGTNLNIAAKALQASALAGGGGVGGKAGKASKAGKLAKTGGAVATFGTAVFQAAKFATGPVGIATAAAVAPSKLGDGTLSDDVYKMGQNNAYEDVIAKLSAEKETSYDDEAAFKLSEQIGRLQDIQGTMLDVNPEKTKADLAAAQESLASLSMIAAETPDNITLAFGEGSVAAAQELTKNSVTWGTNISDSLLGSAPQIGAAIGASLRDAIGAFPVQVTGQPNSGNPADTPRLDTGSSTPF